MYVFSVGGARVGGILITSITFPYIIRELGVKEYGVWSYVVAICAFLDVLSNPGLTTYASREIAAHREASFNLIADILTLRFVASLLACGVLAGVVLLESQHEIRELFVFYGIGFLISGVIAVDYLLSSLEMFHVASGLRLGQQIIYAAGIFIFVRGARDIFWVPGSILFSALVANSVGWLWLRSRGLGMTMRFRPSHWKAIIVPSFHYALSSFMSSIYHRSGHILVRWCLGEYALGIYAAAVRLVDILRNLVVVILSVLGPRMAFASGSRSEFKRWAQLAMVAVAMTSIPMALGLMATSKWVVPLVMGPQYLSGVPLVRWMSLYIITASAASLLAGGILYAMGRHKAYLIATATGAIGGIILYSVLVPAVGLKGAGIAFVSSELFVAVAAFALLPKEIRELWKTPAIGFAAGSGVLMLGVVRIIGIYEPELLVLIASGIIVYAALCGLFLKRWFASRVHGTV